MFCVCSHIIGTTYFSILFQRDLPSCLINNIFCVHVFLWKGAVINISPRFLSFFFFFFPEGMVYDLTSI